MAYFAFDIKPLFPQEIIKVTSNLLPHTFQGDELQCSNASSKMSQIINRLGQLSAISQGLIKPVTTAQRLSISENHTLYLLADADDGKNGAVTGLLKVGTKDLYLFDEEGQIRKMEQTPSILDFYVHESRQRTGLGKLIFENMLENEQWKPVKCTVDRPTEKLLAFLAKHYGLIRTIPQSNNFVLYEGFFNNAATPNSHIKNGPHITNRSSTQLSGATRSGSLQRTTSASNQLQQVTQIAPYGRYGAPRPTCTMAQMFQVGNSATSKDDEAK